MPNRLARAHSRTFSIYDGLYYSIMVGAGETYFSAFAVFLGANNFQMGLLASLPPFLGGLSQLLTVGLLKRIQSRKKLVFRGVVLQALILLPMIITYYMQFLRLDTFITLVCFYMITGQVIGPAWNSWMADLVDQHNRGTYFGKRTRVVTLGTYISMTASGFLLKHFEVKQATFWGFALIFIVASIARFTSASYLGRKYDPPGNYVPERSESFLSFMRTLKGKPYGPLMVYMGLVNFAVYVSAAYFTPYMLKTLQWDYKVFTLVTGGTMLMKFVTAPFWGQVIDQKGAKIILVAAGIFISLVTLPWMFTGQPLLIFFAQVYGGLVWAGWELASFTLLLEAVPAEKRAQDISYFNILNGACALLGGLAGAGFVDFAPHILNHPFALVYGVSALLRMAFVIAFASHISETPLYAIIKSNTLLLGAVMYRSARGGIQLSPIILPIKKSTRSKDQASRSVIV